MIVYRFNLKLVFSLQTYTRPSADPSAWQYYTQFFGGTDGVGALGDEVCLHFTSSSESTVKVEAASVESCVTPSKFYYSNHFTDHNYVVIWSESLRLRPIIKLITCVKVSSITARCGDGANGL